METELFAGKPVVTGLKQARRAVMDGRAAAVYIASDAEDRISQKIDRARAAERDEHAQKASDQAELAAEERRLHRRKGDHAEKAELGAA